MPPPVTELDRCLGELEAFMHEDVSGLPHLVKAGLPHVQFETIHPFLDGNGRMGRLLVTLYLCVHGGLTSPLLYLSLYLKTHRAEYYRLLQDVRERGAWPEWLAFFLRGVEQTATQAFTAATRIERRGLVWRRDRRWRDRTPAVLVIATAYGELRAVPRRGGGDDLARCRAMCGTD